MGSMPFSWPGATGPFSSDGDLKRIRTGHRRAVAVHHMAGGVLLGGGAMDPHSGIHLGVFQNACRYHLFAAVVSFFTGLKHELNSALDLVLILHQNFGRTQQHGGVGVVTAGVGRFRVLAGKRQAGLLCHRQGIHIRPQQEHLSIGVPSRTAVTPPPHSVGS